MSKKIFITFYFLFFYAIYSFSQQKEEEFIYNLTPECVSTNNKTTERVNQNKQIQLKKDIASLDSVYRKKPDIIFEIKAPSSGWYEMISHVKRQEILPGYVKDLCIQMQFDNLRKTKRIVSDARDYEFHVLGSFFLPQKKVKLKIWLPRNIQFEKIEIKKYIPTKVPTAAQNYQPNIIPPRTHPRLWVNKESLPLIRSRLNKKENSEAWQKVENSALKKYTFHFSPLHEISYSTDLEKNVETKAFYYLMTGNKSIGKEAIGLILNYLSVLEYGNINYGDITRNIGHSIYVSALVYDWCNDLLTEKDKEKLYNSMMLLARKMSIGWPPFKESVVNGHGAEAQVNRDLLAMSIAIYERDPIPYKYTSFVVLEELVPMRRFEYQSSRHSQGIDYGAYRHMWEMNAAWLFYRMSGLQVFDDNIKRLPLYWLYMRLPNGQLFRDGDVFRETSRTKSYYWKQPEMLLLDYTYSDNAILKGEFLRQGELPDNPILFLLLNNPDLIPQKSYSHFPLAIETGPVTGSLISRTGWDMSASSKNVIAEIKGGGFHFGNHQHADAGAIQLYYHGMQICDLGLYIAYGIPYDFNFNKRSVSHSMMLVVDPKESFGENLVNDGGTKFNRRCPKSLLEAQQDKWFDNGTVISSDIGYTDNKFLYSYFKVDLTKAYTHKIKDYKKTFCFVNTKREDIPAFIITLDDITTIDADLKKYWKINTLNKPTITDSVIILHNKDEAEVEGKVHIKTILPSIENRDVSSWNNQDTCHFIDSHYTIVKTQDDESKGYHIAISPKSASLRDKFLNVFIMTEDSIQPLPVNFKEKDGKYIVNISDYIVVLNSDTGFIKHPFNLYLSQSEQDVILTGLKPGRWRLFCQNNNITSEFTVNKNKCSFSFKSEIGNYIISPIP
ncbi:hypothetical protein [Maribellus sp. YY47]|uniref:hypothetical protein n=1 Tax=Maribellus sp. YY47 TaxID=2929486 RepID=UPI0020013702|nr:hypothetical protein [Maribellus sp. YY47]MCK3684370.1 hypothetical protein [Maribellus sp. YY47]